MKRSKPKSVSSKQAAMNRRLHLVYAELDADWDRTCKGCGTNKPCTHSHLVPRSYNWHLTATRENITYHCHECHDKWERQREGVKDMLDYELNREIVKRLDINYYIERLL